MSFKSIFQEGMKERKRRKSLGRVNTQFKDKEKVHSAQLTALGQRAWEAKTDLSAYADLKAALGDLQKTLDDLRGESERLKKQKLESEAERKRENERLGAGQKEAEERKRETEGRLNEQKKLQQDGQAEIQRATSRLSAIANERSQLQGKVADPAVAEKAEIAKGLERLAGEEGELKAAISALEEAGKPVAAQVATLQENASRLQKQLEGLRSEQKKMAAEMDKKIAALSADLGKNGERTREAEGRQQAEFKRLGEKLAAAAAMDPNLAKEMAAVQGARAEMEGVQAMISGLERQKDRGQVSAYKKMMAIIIGGIALIAAIVIALFILLAPKKSASPIGGLGGPEGGAARNMAELAQQMEKGFGGIKAESERLQGGGIELATEAAMKAALPQVGGWQPQKADYNQGVFGDLKTASMHAEYVAGGDTVYVEITDAGTASALLAPLKMVFSLNMRVDSADVFQQTSTVNGIPVAERVDKRDHEASFGIVYKDRYLIELKTRASRGLDLLREFAAKLDLSRF